MGSGCSAVVDQTPHVPEVVGSNPVCWAFFLVFLFVSSKIFTWSLIELQLFT